jgi:alpha-tubulin suppressor-like RCC1 family protein
MAGCSYHHSVLLCSDGSLFSCGRNDCGQLGHGDFIDKKTPHIVPPLPLEESPKEPPSEPSFKEHSSKEPSASERRIIGLSCGQFHTVLLDINGLTYSCGKNDYGQLCMEGSENIKNFTYTIGAADKVNFYIYKYIYIYLYMYVCVYVHISIYRNTYRYIYTYIHIYIYICTYIFTYIFIHTYIFIFIGEG